MKPTALILATLALSSCTTLVGPNHQVPETKLPDRWSSGTGGKATLSAQWWRSFHDRELNRLQELALATNQDLELAMQRIEEARADFRSSRADLSPSLNTGASASRSQSSGNSNQIPGFTPPEVSQYRLTSGLSYELDLWGKIRRANESAQAGLEAKIFAKDAVMLRLTGEVATQYFSLRTLDAEKAFLDETIALRRTSLEIAKTKHQGGLTPESDVTRATSSLASAEADVADIIRRRQLSVHTLAELCGQPASGFRVSVSKTLADNVPEASLSSPASLLKQRPDIAEAERNVAAKSAAIGTAMGERLPFLKLSGSLNLESLTLSDLLSKGSKAFSIGPEISLPIVDGGLRKAKVKKAQAQHQQAVAEYRSTVLAALKEVEDALANQLGYRDLTTRHRTNVEAATKTTAFSLERYQKGIATYLEVVDSQREELQARRSLLQAEGNRLSAAVQLIKALGGG